MRNKAVWVLALAVACSCNNESKPATDHTGHVDHNEKVTGNTYSDSVNHGLISTDTLKGSPRRTAIGTVNGADVQIVYNSPGVRGRNVWGGLVPYDKVWVTGAHEATSIQFSKDVVIGGKQVPLGQYAFFTIPGREKWTVIINTRYKQHQADEYNEKEDVVRIDVKPQEHEFTQRLTYSVEKTEEKAGEIVVLWEKVMIKVPFTVL